MLSCQRVHQYINIHGWTSIHLVFDLSVHDRNVTLLLLSMYFVITEIGAHYGSFTPKLNLQPTGFRLASNWLQTGKIQLGYTSIAWFHSHQFWTQKPARR